MRKISVAAITLFLTLGAMGALALLLTRPPGHLESAYPSAMVSANALLAEPAPAPPQEVQEIVAPNMEILGRPAHHPGATRRPHRLNCGDWQDLQQGPAASKVRRCN
jgi:hypothetical protein